MALSSPLLWLPLSAFAAATVLHILALTLFPKIGLLDYPERYGLKRHRLPYPTGLLAVCTFLLFFAILQTFVSDPPWTAQAIGLTGAVVLLAVVSFLDDRTPLPCWLRLLVQVIIALAIFLTGTRIYSLTNPLVLLTGHEVIHLDTLMIQSHLLRSPSLVGALFTVVWLGLTMNALNWADGVRGQVSTLSTIGFLTIGFLSLSARVNDPALALLAFVLASISAACILFDFPPAHVLLGDTGSMFFGLLLGVLTIYSGGKVATGFLVLGVPLIDSGIVVFRRLRKGTSPFRGSTGNEHLHHRLLKKGWSERQIVFLTAGLGTLFGTTALFLNTFEKFLSAVALFLIMLWLSLYSGRKGKAFF
ncbi:MAG: MraY family glycosyltransferase [Candidatus Peribacteraceae bacterium]|nr:MraY family glycosyltransferase [Candidatus Peribacteraceae bacterium]